MRILPTSANLAGSSRAPPELSCSPSSKNSSIPTRTRPRRRRRAASSRSCGRAPRACAATSRAMTFFTALIGAFEALLFGMLGHIVDWLAAGRSRRSCGREQRGSLLLLAAILAASVAARRAAVAAQAAGAGRQLPDAAALELPPPDARPEHELLPGRVRRPHRDQGDADRARGARHLDDRAPTSWSSSSSTSSTHARACSAASTPGCCCRSSAGWRCTWLRCAYFVPRLGRVAQAAGRRALADDRAHHRRLHQHRDRQAVLARAARGRLRARRDAGVPGHRARADAAGHRLRDRQPRAQHGR